jgi:hypothetical protein
MILVASKATGAVNPRVHFYRFDTGVWVHEDAATAVGNGANVTGGQIWHGTLDASTNTLDGKLAVTGLWGSVLSDANVEALETGRATQRWMDLAPLGLWDFNQGSTAIPVRDVTGGGADETSVTGTTVVTGDDPASWIFGVSPPGIRPDYTQYPKPKLRTVVT